MGMFDDDEQSNQQDDSNRLLQEEITQNKVELEQKRRSLAEERTAIIKSSGGQVWQPNKSGAVTYSSPKPPVQAQKGKSAWSNFFDMWGMNGMKPKQ